VESVTFEVYSSVMVVTQRIGKEAIPNDISDAGLSFRRLHLEQNRKPKISSHFTTFRIISLLEPDTFPIGATASDGPRPP
jgi:hypothetical protein